MVNKQTADVSGTVPASEGLLGHVLDLVRNPAGGGLAGLVKTCQEKGLAGVVASWIGIGPNQAISADQITHVIGPARIQAIATKLGVPPETVSGQLAMALPQIVDRLTPRGTVPEGKELEQSLAAVQAQTVTQGPR
jgi:uncharacterized protein YidB (DUF937 family)